MPDAEWMWVTGPATNEVWETWNSISVTGPVVSTTTTNLNSDVWFRTTWRDWQPTGSTTLHAPVQRADRMTFEEESERRRARMARLEEERARVLAQRDEAHERALELLPVVLSKREYAEYQQVGFIRITGSAGNRYEIRQQGYEGNVCQLDEQNEVVMRLCAHPRMQVEGGYLPEADAWIGQILALKADEEAFLAKANVHWSREPVRPRRRVDGVLCA